MRKSLSEFIETCFDIKVYFAVSSYELHDYEDGGYADFKVNKINDPIRVRVFEDFKEY